MTRKLHISEDFALPAEAITQTFAVLAKRRRGKTYTASVMAEEFVDHGLPFVALDPTGAWWGLRASADGKSEGLPVTIIGGAHGDVPLESTAGKVIADLVVDQPGFYVIDLSGTDSNAQQDRFATDFGERLYRRKQSSRLPLHLFIDEADSFAPQRPMPGQQRMLGAFEAIVRRGGVYGLGMTLISQRPAVLNKNVLTQTEVMVLLQTSAPQDQDAIDDWVKRNATKEERDKVMGSLASLDLGEAWIWSPAWLQVCKKVKIRARRTFNSSATPEVGQKVITPQKLAPVDLEKLNTEIKATIERAKANDPAELRAEIAKLKKQLAAAESKPAEVKSKEVPVLKNSQINQLSHLADQLQRLGDQFGARVKESALALQESATSLQQTVMLALPKVPAHGHSANARPQVFHSPQRPAAPRVAPQRSAGSSRAGTPPDAGAPSTPTGGPRRMMIALAQRPGISAKQLGVRAGLSSTSGTFGTYLGHLRSNGWISGDRNSMRLTDAGATALGSYEPLPEGRELLEYHLRGLGQSGASKMLAALAEVYPKGLSAEELGERVDMSSRSGTFGTYLGKLRTLELIQGTRAELKASEEFFV